MRILTVGVVLLLAVACTVRAEGLQIDYAHATLTSVRVDERGMLRYAWHSVRRPFDKKEALPVRQGLAAYDAHEISVWLTKEELDDFTKWVQDKHIMELQTKYPAANKTPLGASERSSLTVVIGNNRRAVSWNGDSQIPESLTDALKSLQKMCVRIREDREDK